MSFYIAHSELAEMALASGDTTTALSELALATELRGTDVGVRLRYGDVLSLTGETDDAVEQYRAAIEAEPYFAHPYLRLGIALETLGNQQEAAEYYRQFLARSSRLHSDRADAESRLARLAQAGDSDN